MAIKNILAVRNDRLGEFLLNIPAFRALKDSYPGSRLTLAVNPYLLELARSLDFTDEIISWENRSHRFGEVLKFSRGLKAKKFDLCVIFNPSREFNIISFLAGIPRRVGYNRKLAILLTHKIEDRKYLGLRHEVEYNLELAALAGAGIRNTSLSLNISDNAMPEGTAISAGDTLVAVHPWTSDPQKEWPLERFYALARELAKLDGIKVVIIGGKDELSRGADIFLKREDGFINAVGKTSLRQLAVILKKCRLLVSVDSGPVHLAAALGVPVIALFKSGTAAKGPGRWGPWGAGHIVIENADLLGITVDEVLSRAREVLKR